jgi:excisionase family DNA binding protein
MTSPTFDALPPIPPGGVADRPEPYPHCKLCSRTRKDNMTTQPGSSVYLTTAEAGLILRLRPKIVARYARTGILPASRVGRKFLIRLTDIHRFVAANAVPIA